jgi:hemolysin III
VGYTENEIEGELSVEEIKTMRGLERWIREPFCGISHLIGAVLSVVGMCVLLFLAHGRMWHIIGFTIYGLSLIALYTISTLYHSLKSERHLATFQTLDYVSIFLLIAGSYTPLCLTVLRGTVGWSMLGAVYALAILGILLVTLWKQAPHWPRVVLYILLGWLAALALPTLRSQLPPGALAWMVAGGIVYTGGVAFYAHNKPKFFFLPIGSHDVWHLFVLGGSFCHFIMMCRI